MKRRIRSLVLDLGGVLTRPQDPAGVRLMMDELGLDGDFERFRTIYFAHRGAYDRGAITGGEYWSSVALELGVEPPAGRLPAIMGRDMDSWFRYRPRMLKALPALRSRVRSMALLSNIHHDGVARLNATFPRLELLDHLVLSCDLGLLKPEAAIYEACLAATGERAAETLFVDDSAANAEGAARVGMAAIRFIDEDQFFEELETFYELAT